MSKTKVAASIACCLILIYVCTVIGITNIPISDVNRILLYKILHIGPGIEGISEGSVAIIFNLRLPRVILAFITGAALAVSGAAYQGIFKNPMADPYILGVSSGAALGATIGIVLNLSTTMLGLSATAIFAFIGAFVTIFLVYSISKVGRTVPVTNLLLSGVAFSQTTTAFMSLIMIFNVQNMNQIMFWTMGSLNGKGWNQVLIVLPYVIIGIVYLLMISKDLDLLLLGENTALQLGVDVERIKRNVLIFSSLMTAAVVSVTGIIGFVGLVVPHMVRIVTGPKHKILMPMSLLVGGTFLILCDTLARSLLSQEIPVGIITAVFGGPFFIYLLKMSRKQG